MKLTNWITLGLLPLWRWLRQSEYVEYLERGDTRSKDVCDQMRIRSLQLARDRDDDQQHIAALRDLADAEMEENARLRRQLAAAKGRITKIKKRMESGDE